ncbi:MAG: S41 family peptidase [Candidatus Gracilibacteria bacterium]|nr:S41 family peptidase [Candidatus Gracilibacteria bacterium]
MPNRITKTHLSALFIIIFLLGLILGYFLNIAKINYFGKDTNVVLGNRLQLGLLDKIWQSLEKDFLYDDDLDKEKAVWGSAEGLVAAAGDPYTVFLRPELNKELDITLDTELEGIGAEVAMEAGYLTIISVLPDSPARQAGLQSGDVIYEVDGKATVGMNVYEAVALVRGPDGSEVDLTMIRSGKAKPFEVKVKRSKLDIPLLDVNELEDGILYIGVGYFGDKLMDQLSEHYNLIKSDKTKAIVWDMRYNTGGLLEEAVALSSEFLPEGQTISWRKYKNFKEAIKSFPGFQNFADLNKPMVLLLNEGSASATEIFAGVLRDYELATLVGETTLGKGSMQQIEELSGGSSLKVTIAEWLTPKEYNINGIGISPDIEVEFDLEADYDTQLQKAIDVLKEKTQILNAEG